MPQGDRGRGCFRGIDCGHRARYDGVERGSCRCADATAGRVLPVVRSSRQVGSAGDHCARASASIWRRSSGAAVCTHTSGGLPRCCIGCGTILTSATQFASAFEHCDMVAATLAGVTDPSQVVRSVCALGHKWMWNQRWGGFPSQEFLSSVDPLLDGVRGKLQSPVKTSDHVAGHLSEYWAEQLGLKAGIPIPVGAFDAHWDAVGAGIREGDVVNVIGTSTCIIAISRDTNLVPGVCGIVPGSVHPAFTGLEAGLSAVGDIFDAIARRAGTSVQELSKGWKNIVADRPACCA